LTLGLLRDEHRALTLSFLYQLFCRLLQLIRLIGRTDTDLAIEVVVLRHEVAILTDVRSTVQCSWTAEGPTHRWATAMLADHRPPDLSDLDCPMAVPIVSDRGAPDVREPSGALLASTCALRPDEPGDARVAAPMSSLASAAAASRPRQRPIAGKQHDQRPRGVETSRGH
jgi:hypothetical protein